MVTLYDTTLRDGTQREGMSLSVEDKLRIAAKLDLLGFITASGGIGPYNFTVSAGTLPTGLSLSLGGNISGTAGAAGTSRPCHWRSWSLTTCC